MSDRGTDAALSREIGSLIAALEDLQEELGPDRRERRRLPTPRDLVRFTSEVTIPATIIVLETNVRVLKLLQRTLRMTAGESPRDGGREQTSDVVRDRAKALGRQSLDQLDAALQDLQSSVNDRPREGEATELLREARRLQSEIRNDLAASAPEESSLDAGRRSTGVNIDVDSEIESIKDQIEDEDSDDADDET